MGETRGRRKYDREFKEDAIRLILDGGRPVREVARDLGIHENMLHRWKQECMSSNDSDTRLRDDIAFSLDS